MSLFVNTNTASLNTQRQLLISGNGLNQAFQRLSSGYRINSASDDAAGLQISNRLTSQINGLNQAVRNANDGISMAQVAEGAMNEISNSLQRIRTLTIQSQNGINNVYDRDALQKEISQLTTEINRIADTTQFGDKSLLTGDLKSDFLVGAHAGQNISISLENTGGYGAEALSLDEIDVIGVLEPKIDGAPLVFPNRIYMPGDTYEINPGVYDYANGTPGIVSGLQVWGETLPDFELGTDPAENANILAATINEMFPLSMTMAEGNSITSSLPYSITFSIADKALTPEDAERNRQEITRLTGIPASLLGQQAHYSNPPTEAMISANFSHIDEALKIIDSARAELGAVQNRFQATIRNLSNISENVSAARSRIRDTDFAKETAELTRTQILQQVSTTVLAQANQRPQAALSLLQ